MIFYNGSNALNGILWGGPEEKPTRIESVINVDEVQKSIKKSDSKDYIVEWPISIAYDSSKTEVAKSNHSIKYGIFDPESHFSMDSIFHMEEMFISWVNYDRNRLIAMALSLKKRNIRPFITIEPWPLDERKDELLSDILLGKYDFILDQLSVVLNEMDSKLYLSWGHEMDQDLVSRYPWSGAEPLKFIDSYRYVVDYLNKEVKSEISWIWSPVVKKGCKQFWPGPEYADFIGMPIYSFPDWDKSYYGYIRDFSTTFNEKYNIIKSLDKPVIITEMGVTGSFDFQEFWLRDAFIKMQEIQGLYGVIFFYAKDTPGAWGEDIGTPDWRCNEEMLRAYVNWYKKNR